jgi:uncharacterized Zn-binding protein involved in type VI secretion
MGILIAVAGNPNTSCGHTLGASAPKVYIEGKLVGLNGDSSGGSVSASQSTVKSGGKDVLLKGDGVAGHGDAPHTPQNLSTPPQSTVFIGE